MLSRLREHDPGFAALRRAAREPPARAGRLASAVAGENAVRVIWTGDHLDAARGMT
jgi:hypothetical protein